MPATLRWITFGTAALLAACSGPTSPHWVGTLEWERVELVADAAEPIAAINVKEGDRVTAGQVILQLDGARVQAQLDAARANRNQAAARLKELVRGPRAERILEASARMTGAEHVLDVRKQELERAQQLLAQKLTSPEDVDRARAAYETAQADRNAARAVLDELQAGNTKEEIEQARQAVVAAESSARVLEVTLDRLTVRAPHDARVDAVPLRVGERPTIGAVVAVVLEGARPYARVYVPEQDRAQVKPGDAAQVRIDGVAEPAHGVVRTVSADPAFTPYFALTEHDRGRLSYLAKIDLVDGPQDLPGGIPVEVNLEQAPH